MQFLKQVMALIILAIVIFGIFILCGWGIVRVVTPDTPTDSGPVWYDDCSQAGTPITTGQPGYRSGLDRNQDGIACNNP